MIREQRQVWHNFVRYLLMSDWGSIQLELYPEPKGEYGVTAYIYGLWIDHPYRRKGEAIRLLKRAEEIAKEAGRKAVHLEWDLRDTPREVLQHLYINTEYDDIAFGDGYAMLKKELNQK